MATSPNPAGFTPGFHYGGSLTPKGRVGRRPESKQLFSRLALVERVVRLDIGAVLTTGNPYPAADIARLIGRSPRYVRCLRETPDYLRMRLQIQTGVAIGTDASQKDLHNYRVAQFKEMLPDAIRVIADEFARPAITPFDRKLKLDLARDLMDREGTFPKISKTENKLKIEHDFSQTDAIANELLSVMDSPTQFKELPLTQQRALEANSSFTNSETLSSVQQEEALEALESFQPDKVTVIN